jgi:hypothetical protein
MDASGSHAQTRELEEVVVKPKRAKFSKFESSESESEPEQPSQSAHRMSSESENERNTDAKDGERYWLGMSFWPTWITSTRRYKYRRVDVVS